MPEKTCCQKFKYLAVEIGTEEIPIHLMAVRELSQENNWLHDTLVKFCPICGNRLELHWQAP